MCTGDTNLLCDLYDVSNVNVYITHVTHVHPCIQVIPTYYATFTLSCIIGAAVVYREFEGLSYDKIFLFMLGVLISGLGVKIVSTREEGHAESSVQGDEELSQMTRGDGEEADNRVDGQVQLSGQNGERKRLIEMDELALVQQCERETVEDVTGGARPAPVAGPAEEGADSQPPTPTETTQILGPEITPAEPGSREV